MKNITRNTLLSVAALGFSVGMSMSAAAKPLDETYVSGRTDGTRTIRIEYNAADLATAQGLKNLHSKIMRAARQVCGPTSYHEAGGIRNVSRNRECYNETVEAAFSQLGSNPVAAIGS